MFIHTLKESHKPAVLRKALALETSMYPAAKATHIVHSEYSLYTEQKLFNEYVFTNKPCTIVAIAS